MFRATITVFVFSQLTLASLAADEAKFDLVLQAGRIIDGTGAPWYIADVGIRNGKIAKIGRIAADQATTAIDASGLIVAPGFIDMMGQTATPMLDDPKTAINLLTQGITTINAGEGASAAPLGNDEAATRGWGTMAEYFQLIELQGLPVNVVQTVGHTQVRRLVLGEVDRRPSDEELDRMRSLVREAMEAGAIGVSTALIYPPAVYARTEEIAALAEVAGQHGGRYYTHMRNEGDLLLEAIDEALDIGRTGKTPVHIFHLKAAGQQNWGKMQLAIAKIKSARSEGEQVTADIYPYINNGLGITAFIHPRHFGAGQGQLIGRLDDANYRDEIRKEMETTGGWENWYRHVGHDWDRVVIGQAEDPRYAELVGQSVAAMAKAREEDPWATFFNLVRTGAFALPQSMTDANKISAMQQDFVSFCTDVGPAGGSRIASHPRAFGAFPRLLSHYVRDLGAISLERAVAQASAAAANDVLAFDRGRIAEGLAADVIVFDYNALADKATFAKPNELSEGMRHVIVNGKLVLKDGQQTDELPGRVLRGPGYRAETAPHTVSTGELDKRFDSFDRMMREYMERHRVPGAALAVTDRGRIVFARGYGYSDIATRKHVTADSLFRIASISKPITAVAILQLVEQGKLKLDDKVFAVLDYEADITAAGDRFDARQRDITIQHLLEHRGGWDRDLSFDGMFRSVEFAAKLDLPAPAGPEAVIRSMLGHKLDFDPGHRYAYSNYGYCLLGRVVEKLSGQSYEQYVQEHVLAPLDIHAMCIGKTRLDGRQPGEVRYYYPGRGPSVFQDDLGQDVPWPYGGWYLEGMDSHGAWLASATDLAKFAAAFDDPQNCKILSADSIATMFARPPALAGYEEDGTEKAVFYSLGWFNRKVGEGQQNNWHTGSLSGTATILIRRHDGRNFIALFNARSSPGVAHFGRDIDPLLHQAAKEVSEWPQ
jgi:N-acyl-D-amino-acid deacylase